jgi:DNA-binding winged helix-turn-helix (wHTH) protein
LPPKAFELLVLVEHRGHPLEKDELMRRLWLDTFVKEANLANNISLLRKALAAGQKQPYIETAPRLPVCRRGTTGVRPKTRGSASTL